MTDLEIRGDLRLHLVRMTLEAIRNASRHSGAAPIRVDLEADEGRIHIEVQDDGRGIPASARGRTEGGLANMRERAAKLGGRVELISGDRGTRLLFDLPVA